jgi:hypothetical protein
MQFQAIEKAATQAHWVDLASGSFAASTDIDTCLAASDSALSMPLSKKSPNKKSNEKKEELDLWNSRKERRQNDKSGGAQESVIVNYVQQDISDDAGHYKIGESIYLEGAFTFMSSFITIDKCKLSGTLINFKILK